MPKLRGTHFVSLKSYITHEFGYSGWRKFLKAVPTKDKKQIEMPSANSWYDVALSHRCLRTMYEKFGEGDKELVFNLGKFSAEKDLHSVKRLFLRMANPAYVIEKAGEYWGSFCDWGRWEIERKSKTLAVAKLVDIPIADEFYCLRLQGYLLRLLELVGAKNAVVKHVQCQAKGGDYCTFVGNWEN